MARNKNKNLLLKAKIARRERLEASRLDITAKIDALEEGTEGYDEIRTGLFDQLAIVSNEENEFEERRDNARQAKADGKQALREARADAGLATRGKRIEWQEGGRELVPGRSESNATFFGAQEAGLAKVSRDIGRWETLDPYENVRGVNKGEIVMIISEKYLVDVGHSRRKTKSKWAVDLMVGPHVIKGVPAAALRPLEED